VFEFASAIIQKISSIKLSEIIRHYCLSVALDVTLNTAFYCVDMIWLQRKKALIVQCLL